METWQLFTRLQHRWCHQTAGRWTPADCGRALPLDAYVTGELFVEDDGSQQHVPIYETRDGECASWSPPLAREWQMEERHRRKLARRPPHT